MGLYYSLLAITFVLLFASRFYVKDYNGEKKQSILISIALVLVIVVAGIRWNVGTDFVMYNDFFNIYKNGFSFSLSIEPMFKIFCRIPGMFFEKSTATFILIAIYTYSLTFTFCKKNCKYYDLSFFLFISMGFYFSSLNIVRQWMAIPAMLLTYNYLSEKKYIKSTICFLLSYFSHYTSILLLPILLIATIITKEKTRILLILLSIVSFVFSNQIILIIQNILLKISILSKYAYYFSKSNSMNASFIIPIICIITYIYYLIFYGLSNDKKENNNEEYYRKINMYVNILIFAFMFTLLGSRIDIFERMSHYFFPIIIVILPMIIEKMKIENNKKIVFCAILLLGVAFFTNTMLNNGGEILPYKTIMEVKK